MKEMVDAKYVHRDLKPENTFIHENIFKIADFGFS
jgi:serine/threonine protein kinase